MTGFLHSGLWGLCWLVSSGSKARLSTSQMPCCPPQKPRLSTSKGLVVHLKSPGCPHQKALLSAHAHNFLYIAKFSILRNFGHFLILWITFSCGHILWTKSCGLADKVCGQSLWTKFVDKSLWTKVCGEKFVDKSLWTTICGQKFADRQHFVDRSLWTNQALLKTSCGQLSGFDTKTCRI